MFANTYPIGRMVVFVSIIFCVPFINGTPTEAADRPPDSGTFLQTLLYEVQPLVGSNSPNENSWMRFSVLSNESHDSRRSDCLPERVISEGFTSQLEATEVFRAQSPGGCTGITEGCGYAEKQTPHFRLTEFNIYPTFSYLDDSSATYNEFEFASHTDFGFVEMENRTVLNVADLPGTIALGPTNPGDPGGTADIRANGFGDILSGFFFSPKGSHASNVHVGVGPVITFPTASNDILGSNQYTAGPGIHASADIGKLTTGFFLWQSWGWDVNSGDKRANQLFGKPFVIYEIAEKWDLVYIPLGLSHSWKAKTGDDWTVPVGGGFRRRCNVRGQEMGFQVQAFDYVARKSKDPEWELRFAIEFLFDE